MQGRFYSRGNVAVAALVFVALIGVGAIALDSAHIAQNPRAQLAADAAATNSSTAEKPDAEISQTCEVGYDYIVRYDKAAKVSPTIDGKTEKTKATGNQCVSSSGTMLASTADGKRSCVKGVWESKVYVCTPKSMTVKGETEDCQLIPKRCKTGENLNQSGAKNFLVQDIAANLENAESPQDAKRIADAAKGLDPSISKGILDSFGGDDTYKQLSEDLATQKGNLDRANEESLAALAAYNKCTSEHYILSNLPQAGLACSDENTALAKADIALAEQQKKYEELAEQAQPLNALKGNLSPEGTAPDGPGSICTKDVCNPKTQLEVLDLQKKGYTCNGLGTECTKSGTNIPPPNKKDTGCQGSTFGCGGNGGGGGGSGGAPPPGAGASSGLGGLAQYLPLAAGLLGGFLQQSPSCTLTASPANVSQVGQPVTLSWQAQNAQSAYLSNAGQVGPSGSMQVQPQQTTTYTMQVMGAQQQQQQQQQYNPYGGYNPYGQQQGQYVWNPQLGAYVYMQAPVAAAQQNPYGQIGQQIGQLFGGGSSQGQCQVQVTVGGQGGGGTGGGGGGGDGGGGGTGGTGTKPTAQISCQPKIADVGMQVAISYACQNAATSGGSGFTTGGALSGSATAQVTSPTLGSTSVTYGITCSNQGQIDSAQCTVNVNKPSIVLVANPKNIKSGETSTIGWVTGAMESCVVSSPTLSQFTVENQSNTSASGVAKTPALTQDTKFVLTCATKAGGTKVAEVTVEIDAALVSQAH